MQVTGLRVVEKRESCRHTTWRVAFDLTRNSAVY
jgi:hypothetical protein